MNRWNKYQEKQALALHNMGKNARAISEIMGTPAATVRERIPRVKAKAYQAYLDSIVDLQPSITFLQRRGYFVHRTGEKFTVDSKQMTPEQVVKKARQVRRDMEILAA